MSQENIEKLKEGYRLWHEGKASSYEFWMDLMHDNVNFASIAEGKRGFEFASTKSAKEEVRDYFEGVVQQWEMIHYTPHEYLAQGDRIVMLGETSWRNRKTGKVVDTKKCDVFRFEDKKIIEFMEFFDTAQAVDCCD